MFDLIADFIKYAALIVALGLFVAGCLAWATTTAHDLSQRVK